MRGKATLTDLIFPWGTYCVCCGKYIDRTRTYLLCDHCIEQIQWGHFVVPPETLRQNAFTGPAAEAMFAQDTLPIDSVRACMRYGLYARRLIFALKYDGQTFMARVLAQILYDRILSDPAARDLLSADFLVPAPLHRQRYRERGFNQVERIARHLGRSLGIPVVPDGLRRVRASIAQRSVAGNERLENLHDAFGPGTGYGRKGLAGSHVILLDDIFTTGATGLLCGRALRDAGARRVDVLVVASGNQGLVAQEDLP